MASPKLIVAYPPPKDAEAFDAVYEKEHVPLAVAKLAGKTRIVATKVLDARNLPAVRKPWPTQ